MLLDSVSITCLAPNIRNKKRMSAFTTAVQHRSRCCGQNNEARKEIKDKQIGKEDIN